MNTNWTNAQNNLSVEKLLNEAVLKSEGVKTPEGALLVDSRPHTGRCAQDKYIVETAFTKEKINWKTGIRVMTPDQFNSFKTAVVNELQSKNVYIMDRSVGADEEFNLGVKLITTRASAALFSHHMFLPQGSGKLGTFTIYHAPHMQPNPAQFNLRATSAIAMNFDTKEIVITGTAYAGEVKKAMFTAMNVLLPDHGVLPMHAGANQDKNGNVSVFFGLSGTGKTTLSTDTGRELIGDDEIGLSDKNIFNFENGCYAKTINLTAETEPEIFQATKTPNTLIENVLMDPQTFKLDFFDKTITENGRASYPMSILPNKAKKGWGNIPKNFFFLSADAFGVLPPVSSLTQEEAMKYFLLGYTAKVAGTEVGLTEPTATFSACFGAPFMVRNPKDYAELLKKKMHDHNIKVWLINTGWGGGAYGVGSRFPLKVTRSIIRAIQETPESDIKLRYFEPLNLNIPESLPGIDSTLFDPSNSWKNKNEYLAAALKLKTLFDEKIG